MSAGSAFAMSKDGSVVAEPPLQVSLSNAVAADALIGIVAVVVFDVVVVVVIVVAVAMFRDAVAETQGRKCPRRDVVLVSVLWWTASNEHFWCMD